MNARPTNAPAPARAGRREWLGLAVLALPTLLVSIDIGVLYLALPSLSKALGADGVQQLWIMDIYSFLIAGLLVTMGNLGDRIGRRRLLLIGAALFGVASLLAAFAPTPELLIAARALLGIAAATISPSTMALIRNLFTDPKQMGTAFGIWFACFMGGMLLGPLVGGVLLEHFWWGSVFLLAVPVMAVLLVLGPIVLPEYKDPDAGRLDLISAGLSLVAVLAVIFGLKETAQDGFGVVPSLAIVVGLVVGGLFVRRQLTLKDPVLDLQLFRIPAFSAALTVNFLAIFVAVGYFLFVAQYLQLVLGLSPLEAGLWSVPSAVGFIIGSNAAPRIVRRVRAAYVMGAGLGLAAVGLAVLTQVAGPNGLAVVIIGSVIISLGLAPVMSLTTELIVGSAPPERAGAASGISETGAELGGALGLSILGSIGIAIYRGGVAAGLPVGVPAEAAAAARDTLGGAVAVAQQLPDELGTAVIGVARDAFVQAMQVASTISAVLAVGVAILAVVMLRNVGSGDDREAAADAADSAVDRSTHRRESVGATPNPAV
jgi:DHA2 family multidrug resistance protein-like MFS transporter